MPGIGSPYRHHTRRVFAKGFPHSIVYHEGIDVLIVVAVAPFKRKPDDWRRQK
jgi:hypothetical protein